MTPSLSLAIYLAAASSSIPSPHQDLACTVVAREIVMSIREAQATRRPVAITSRYVALKLQPRFEHHDVAGLKDFAIEQTSTGLTAAELGKVVKHKCVTA